MVLVKEVLLARINGCEETSFEAGVGLPQVGGSTSVALACQMFSATPVAVGIRTTPLSEFPELADLTAAGGDGVAVPAPLPAPLPDPIPDPIPAPSATRAAAPTTLPMQEIPAGTFTMGCTSSQRVVAQGGGCRDGELPAHEVTLTRAFWMATTPITQDQYARTIGFNPSLNQGDANRPVDTVSWLDAASFANALSALEGLTPCYQISGAIVTWAQGLACEGYRLPTEAEWEYAARAGADTTYAGGEDADLVAWHHTNSGGYTQPGGGKQANAFGLYDMSGNVREWVWDWLGDYPSQPDRDPVGPLSGRYKVARGGSIIDSPDEEHLDHWPGSLRNSSRNGEGAAQSYRPEYMGFRIARTITYP
jgi:formylglycine-generating enzyme required for sulfatase activity